MKNQTQDVTVWTCSTEQGLTYIYQLWNVSLQTSYLFYYIITSSEMFCLKPVIFLQSFLFSLSFMFKTRCEWTVNSTRLHWVTRQLTSNSHEAKICVGGMSSEGGGDDMLSGVTPRFSLICNKSCLNNKLNRTDPAHSPIYTPHSGDAPSSSSVRGSHNCQSDFSTTCSFFLVHPSHQPSLTVRWTWGLERA